ncbi:MAG: hypothetical protein IJR88_04105 [Clostridia bacterium]|nr:hypothetical protein [Clostridia bacterium]
MKRTLLILLILCTLFSLASCGEQPSQTAEQTSHANEKAEIQINKSNFYKYFTIQYEFDRNSLVLPTGSWKEIEGPDKFDYKDDYNVFVKKNYNDVIKANLLISIKPKIACSINNVTINGVPKNKNSNYPLKLSSGWENQYAYYNRSIYYNDSDLILERCTPIKITIDSNYEQTTKTTIPYTSSANEFDYDYFDMIPSLYITEISGSIIPLEVDTSKYKHITVDASNFNDYFDIDYKFEWPVICNGIYLAEIYWWDAVSYMTITVKPKSEKIVSFDGQVSVRYERSDLDIDNTYYTRDYLYTATFDINNGKLTTANTDDLKIPNLSYVECDKNAHITSRTNLSESALKSFANNRYSKIKITAILPKTSIDVLVKD